MERKVQEFMAKLSDKKTKTNGIIGKSRYKSEVRIKEDPKVYGKAE